MNRPSPITMGLWFAVAMSLPRSCLAESAVDLLSGFDVARIEAAYPPSDDESTGELAKLAYRIGSVDVNVLKARVSIAAAHAVGSAVSFDGEIRQVRSVVVPERLVEFLEFSQLVVIDVAANQVDYASTQLPIQVVTVSLPEDAAVGDRVAGIGVVMEVSAAPVQEGHPSIVAVIAPRLRWFPRSAESTGWQLLSGAGMDVSLLADAKSRSRAPLLAEDGDAFYSMLSAAAKLGSRDDLPAPAQVAPVTLLRRPEDLGGHWLRMELETVQITRIAVSQPNRQSQLGSDHYYQIDAVADLGNVVVKIERPDGQQGPPAVFENRYPVSVVARELPDFLKQRIRRQQGGDAVVSQHKSLIAVDTFFYRLWSYRTDFMNQHGGGDQFGPLLIAARIDDREPKSNDPAGVNVIGWVAAASVVSGIIAIWLWSRFVSARDLAARRKRQALEAEQLQLP